MLNSRPTATSDLIKYSATHSFYSYLFMLHLKNRQPNFTSIFPFHNLRTAKTYPLPLLNRLFLFRILI